MQKKIRFVLAQLNLCVGDIQNNLKQHLHAAATSRDQLKADVIIFPELGITGYPPEDLLLRSEFLKEAESALENFISQIKNIYCVVSHPYSQNKKLYNACSLIYNGKILGRYAKQHLPNYAVFDEDRYFSPGSSSSVITIHDVPMGLVICEDIWLPGPMENAVAQGARIILSPNASPFEIDKYERRVKVLCHRAKQDKVPILYVNNVGGQDEIVFDGGSMVINAEGNVCQVTSFFKPILFPIDITFSEQQTTIECSPFTLPSNEEKIYQALVLGLQDYVKKNNFRSVVLGLSGGIDSALTASIAVDALGKENVYGVLMPSRHTANISIDDAIHLAHNLEIKFEILSIELMYENFLTTLAPLFIDKKLDITEENIQARCRAIILMALSNKFGHLVLSTGNRSELATGYCTLYGDMAGGFAVLKDVTKTLIYTLANYRNRIAPVIPDRTIQRAPTAELAPNQKDEDNLPPYPILDQILFYYLNQDKSIDDIVAQGFDVEVVKKIVNLIRKNEYKRKQAPIGTRINHYAFGKDRRYPATNGFKG